MRKSAELLLAEANERRVALKTRVADLVAVTAFHSDSMTVDVKPLVKREVAGAYVSPPTVTFNGILATFTARIGGGESAVVRPDINPGDIGVVVYLDLDSDQSIMTGAESQPNSCRIHSGDDAIFIGVITPG